MKKQSKKTKSAASEARRRPDVRRTVSRLFRGQVLSVDFFARHWLPVMIVMLLVIVNIAGKYVCQTRMEKINALNYELEIVKGEAVRVRSIYMGRICESSMQQLVDSMHLGLSVSECPPYRLDMK